MNKRKSKPMKWIPKNRQMHSFKLSEGEAQLKITENIDFNIKYTQALAFNPSFQNNTILIIIIILY